MVSWEDFFQAITTHLDCSLSQAEADHLATVLGKNTLNFHFSPLSSLICRAAIAASVCASAAWPISNHPQLVIVSIVRSRSGSIRNGERHQVS
jgi:hypothetical protein